MSWFRTVTYEIDGCSFEEVAEVWDNEGPECGPGVQAVASSNIEDDEQGTRVALAFGDR